MFGMKALPSVGDLANEADVARPCLSMAFKRDAINCSRVW